MTTETMPMRMTCCCASRPEKCVDDTARMRFPSQEFYLKTRDEMAALFPEYPEALTNTCRIAERCNVEFGVRQLHLPDFPVPAGETADGFLQELCEAVLAERHPAAGPEVRERLEYELSVIQTMGFQLLFDCLGLRQVRP